MVYISASGNLSDKRSNWRLSIISDFFWGIVNFFGLLYAGNAAPLTASSPTLTRAPPVWCPVRFLAAASTHCLWCVRISNHTAVTLTLPQLAISRPAPLLSAHLI